MHGYVKRECERQLNKALSRSPAVVLLGPRQCGKSTLIKHTLSKDGCIYLDLQDRLDRNKLTEPELFFEEHRDKLICLDEIQLLPEFFSVLRSEIDKDRRPGRFVLLGSASRELIRQSNESLAGRVSQLELTPFTSKEIDFKNDYKKHWVRGGYPESFLALDNEDSYYWRENFIRTFMERDIPNLGFGIPAVTFGRLWRILAHYHGQTLNYSKVAEAADLDVRTLKKYIYILEQTYMVRVLEPYETNLKKRLIKSPKFYIRDSGIAHNLLDLESFDDLLSSPVIGASWEGYCVENIITMYSKWRPSFLRTSNGAEVDLILERGRKKVIFEFKSSKAPKPARGFFELLDDIKPESSWLVAPVDESYAYKAGIRVGNLNHLPEEL